MQGGLGLPDKNYYFDADKKDIRTAYVAHIAKVLELSGVATADAQKQADEIVAAGKAAVEIERQNKLREADAQATALARSMCEKLLKHNLTAQDDDQLLDDLLQKAGAGNGN